mmetsp:Transcript_24869/g.59212  ORF Transcript_24869/g.59212 Transcript_24869/m.59212 type:complete len:252 (+) Transcript_24869:106-861(+)
MGDGAWRLRAWRCEGGGGGGHARAGSVARQGSEEAAGVAPHSLLPLPEHLQGTRQRTDALPLPLSPRRTEDALRPPPPGRRRPRHLPPSRAPQGGGRARRMRRRMPQALGRGVGLCPPCRGWPPAEQPERAIIRRRGPGEGDPPEAATDHLARYHPADQPRTLPQDPEAVCPRQPRLRTLQGAAILPAASLRDNRRRRVPGRGAVRCLHHSQGGVWGDARVLRVPAQPVPLKLLLRLRRHRPLFRIVWELL